jgi:hypothetical protein
LVPFCLEKNWKRFMDQLIFLEWNEWGCVWRTGLRVSETRIYLFLQGLWSVRDSPKSANMIYFIVS